MLNMSTCPSRVPCPSQRDNRSRAFRTSEAPSPLFIPGIGCPYKRKVQCVAESRSSRPRGERERSAAALRHPCHLSPRHRLLPEPRPSDFGTLWESEAGISLEHHRSPIPEYGLGLRKNLSCPSSCNRPARVTFVANHPTWPLIPACSFPWMAMAHNRVQAKREQNDLNGFEDFCLHTMDRI
jgi:hypothetical protein